jgi:hypothetical protein
MNATFRNKEASFTQTPIPYPTLFILTQQSRGPASTAARDSGPSAAGMEDMLGFANASPCAAAALAESHTRHMRMVRLLKGAGLAGDEAKVPELLPLLVAARENSLRQAGRMVSVKDVEDEDDEEADRGIGAQAELPPGVPMWAPRFFLPRERTYTRGWQTWILKQGESNRSETDAPIAEGDMLSVVPLWMDYSALTDKLAKAAEDEGDIAPAWALAKI